MIAAQYAFGEKTLSRNPHVAGFAGAAPGAAIRCKGCWCEAEARPVCCPKKRELASSKWSDALWVSSPVVCSIELAKFLNEHGKALFRALGTCMYPIILPGDRLHIQSAQVSEINIGDIAVFRRHGILIGHRTIAKGHDKKGAYIVTRPDRSSSGDDGPSYDRDILGIIRRIERRSRLLDPQLAANTLWKRAGYRLNLLLITTVQFFRKQLLLGFLAALKTRLYTSLANSWLRKPGRKVDFSIQARIQPQTNLFRHYTAQEMDTFSLNDQGSAHWTITAQVEGAPAAMLTFFRCPNDCPHGGWWLAEAHTRIRFRGTEIEEKLLQKAKAIFSGWKVATLRISLPGESPENGEWLSRGFKKKNGCPEYDCGAAAANTSRCNILETAI